MTKPDWLNHRIRLTIVADATDTPDRHRNTLHTTIMALDKHFNSLITVSPAPKGKSTGRPKKHVNLALLDKLMKEKKSLRDMGKSLEVSRETIRRVIQAGKQMPKGTLY